MSVQYDPSPREEREEYQFHDREAIVKMAPFTRGEDGEIFVKDMPEFQYFEEDGQWYRRGATRDEGPTPVDEKDVVFWPTVYYQFVIVAYQEQDGSPGCEHVGKFLPYGSKLKGITTYKDEHGKWWFKMPGLGLLDAKYRTGLFVVAAKGGFDIQALNSESALYSPEYIADEVGTLESPVTSVQVLQKVIEPKLLAAAEAGLLLKVHTSERSNWVQYGSITSLTPEQAARYHEAQASSSAKSEELRDKLRGMAKDAPKDFADRVLALALEVQPGVARDSILEQLAASTMEHIVKRLSEPEPVSQAPSL